MKRLIISHPALLSVKFSHKEHRAFNHHVASDDRRLHHNAIRVKMGKDPRNAEAIAAMMAAAEARSAR